MRKLYWRRGLAALAVMAWALAAPLWLHAATKAEERPGYIIDETIFEAKDGLVAAPNSVHKGSGTEAGRVLSPHGWRAKGEDDYYSFRAPDYIEPEEGTLEITLAFEDVEWLHGLGDNIASLVTFFDDKDVPFFAVGINDHDLMVGSYALHPMLLEETFGGVGFHYTPKLDRDIEPGMKIKITVTWGDEPEEDRVYVNGSLIGVEGRRGPKTFGQRPGNEPTEPLSWYLDGFESALDGMMIGPVKTIAIGSRRGKEISGARRMYPPAGIAISSVRVKNFIDRP